MSIIFSRYRKKVDEMYFLSYPKNMDLYSCKYKFYNIEDNQIKDFKFFSPYMQLKNKGFAFQDI